MGKWYLCTIKPIGEYFFGGEHIFDLYGKEKSYYIRSERLPNQSTLIGMLRFLVLSKQGLLNDIEMASRTSLKARQQEMIGDKGFNISQAGESRVDYGEILNISPAFLIREKSNGKKLHRWVPTPFNHVKGESVYSSFKMGNGYYTDISGKSVVPLNYKAKNGLTDSFFDIDDSSHPVVECCGQDAIFSFEEFTRISRSNPDNGFFKKEYIRLNEEYSIAFYCEVKTPQVLPSREILYLGQDKSAFMFRCTEKGIGANCDPVKSFVNQFSSLAECPDADVYYAMSDIYLPDGINRQGLLYSIVKTKSFRTLNEAFGKDYRSSKRRSRQYQLIQSGSVFYLAPGNVSGLISDADIPGMKQAGFNYLIKLGGA